MAFLHSESEAATAAVKTAADFSIPNEATGVELQASDNDVRYTMDDETDPTQTTGMILVVDLDPETFLIEDFLKIRFVRGAASNGTLNCHFFCGRVVIPE